MSESEIIEGNKLIAEFMGAILVKAPMGDAMRMEKGRFPEPYSLKQLSVHILRYHTSFDWIMTVVEKIVPYGLFRLTIGNIASVCHFETDDNFKKHSSESTIETVWLACVDFIKWYNQQPVKQ